MSSDKAIDECLESVRSGKGGSTSRLLQLLCDEFVFTPVKTVQKLGDEQGTNKVTVASFKRKERNIVPVFTSEEHFFNWSSGKYQCFSLAAADLALTLPNDAWVMINPGHPSSCQLSPSDLKRLSQIDPSVMQTQTSFAAVGREEEAGDPSESDTVSASREEIFRNVSNENSSLVSRDSGELVAEVTSELRQVLVNFAEVQEAYYQEVDSDHTHAVIGLLSNRVTAEKRFHLIDDIAEISRKYYGVAGAIEVYDDLDNTTSASWDLFKAIAPFYTQEQAAALRESSEGELAAEISVSSESDKSENLTSFEKKKDAWEDILKKGSKLLGSLVGR